MKGIEDYYMFWITYYNACWQAPYIYWYQYYRQLNKDNNNGKTN